MTLLVHPNAGYIISVQHPKVVYGKHVLTVTLAMVVTCILPALRLDCYNHLFLIRISSSLEHMHTLIIFQ